MMAPATLDALLRYLATLDADTVAVVHHRLELWLQLNVSAEHMFRSVFPIATIEAKDECFLVRIGAGCLPTGMGDTEPMAWKAACRLHGIKSPRVKPELKLAPEHISALRWMLLVFTGEVLPPEAGFVGRNHTREASALRAVLESAGETEDGQPISACTHDITTRGKDVPRVYGSWRTEVCSSCGAFRTHGHDASRSQLSAWQPASAYVAATTKDLL